MTRSGLGFALFLAVSSVACSLLPKQSIQSSVAPAPHEPWTPPAAARMPASPDPTPPQIPAEYTRPGTTLSLPATLSSVSPSATTCSTPLMGRMVSTSPGWRFMSFTSEGLA